MPSPSVSSIPLQPACTAPCSDVGDWLSGRLHACSRKHSGWRQLLGSRDFRAIAIMNAVMFATANGGRAVLMPLLAIQSFGMTTSVLGLSSGHLM